MMWQQRYFDNVANRTFLVLKSRYNLYGILHRLELLSFHMEECAERYMEDICMTGRRMTKALKMPVFPESLVHIHYCLPLVAWCITPRCRESLASNCVGLRARCLSKAQDSHMEKEIEEQSVSFLPHQTLLVLELYDTMEQCCTTISSVLPSFLIQHAMEITSCVNSTMHIWKQGQICVAVVRQATGGCLGEQTLPGTVRVQIWNDLSWGLGCQLTGLASD